MSDHDDDTKDLRTAIISLQQMGELLGHGFFHRACLAYSIGAMINIGLTKEDFDQVLNNMLLGFEKMKLEKNMPSDKEAMNE